MSRLMLVFFLLLTFSSKGLTDDLQQRLDQIDRITELQGPFALDLVAPMMTVGGLLASQADDARAMEFYESALNILHRQEGVYSEKQAKILNQMAYLSAGFGDIERTTSLYRLRHEVHVRNYGAQDASSIDAQLDLGYWFQGIGRYEDALTTFKEALGNAKASGKLLWQAANGILYTQYLNGTCCDEDLLASSLVALLQDPATDHHERMTATLLNADLQIMSGERSAVGTYEDYLSLNSNISNTNVEILGVSRIGRMKRAYVSAANENRTRGEPSLASRYVAAGELIGSPLPFCAAQLSQMRTDVPLSEIQIHAKVVLSDRGKVKKLRIVESNAPTLVNRLFREVLRTTRFRPAMIDGEVTTAKVDIYQKFDELVSVNDASQVFPPSRMATFHGCHLVADTLRVKESGLSIAILQ